MLQIRENFLFYSIHYCLFWWCNTVMGNALRKKVEPKWFHSWSRFMVRNSAPPISPCTGENDPMGSSIEKWQCGFCTTDLMGAKWNQADTGDFEAIGTVFEAILFFQCFFQWWTHRVVFSCTGCISLFWCHFQRWSCFRLKRVGKWWHFIGWSHFFLDMIIKGKNGSTL